MPASEIDFGGMVDALPGIVWTTLADGRCDFVNRSWRDYTGLGADGARAHKWQSAVHPDDLTSLLKSWSTEQSGHATYIEGRLRRFDGQYRWFTFRSSPFRDINNGNQRWCWLASYADESIDTDARLRRLFDMIPIQAGFLNVDGVLEYANQKSLDDFGMSFEQLLTPSTSGVIHADDLAVSNNSLKALLTEGKWIESETRFLYPDGTYRWTRARCVPIRDAQGNVVRYITCQVDVDDLIRAEALLAAEVKLLEMVTRGESLGLILDSLSRHFEQLCADVFCGVLMVSEDKKHLHLGAAPSLPLAFRKFLDGGIIDGRNDPCSLAVLEKAPIITGNLADDSRWEGSPWPTLMSRLGFRSCTATPILSRPGGVSGVVAVYRSGPTTPALQQQQDQLVDRFAKIAGIAIDRRMAEEALNRARAELAHVARVATLNAMTASIAHEVNQPISGILTNASTCVRMLAADPPNVTGAAETARRTIRDANRAAEVIKRLRTMFANQAPTKERVNLNEAAREVMALSATELQRGRTVLQTQFAENLPDVLGDRIQLQQVILNLLLNAADAMSGVLNRSRTLLVQTEIHNESSVKLLVRDCGVGIDPLAIEKLFAAFYTTKTHGMGVGLAISRSIIESHEGELWAAPNDGPGATFGFNIPRAF